MLVTSLQLLTTVRLLHVVNMLVQCYSSLDRVAGAILYIITICRKCDMTKQPLMGIHACREG